MRLRPSDLLFEWGCGRQTWMNIFGYKRKQNTTLAHNTRPVREIWVLVGMLPVVPLSPTISRETLSRHLAQERNNLSIQKFWSPRIFGYSNYTGLQTGFIIKTVSSAAWFKVKSICGGLAAILELHTSFSVSFLTGCSLKFMLFTHCKNSRELTALSHLNDDYGGSLGPLIGHSAQWRESSFITDPAEFLAQCMRNLPSCIVNLYVRNVHKCSASLVILWS